MATIKKFSVPVAIHFDSIVLDFEVDDYDIESAAVKAHKLAMDEGLDLRAKDIMENLNIESCETYDNDIKEHKRTTQEDAAIEKIETMIKDYGEEKLGASGIRKLQLTVDRMKKIRLQKNAN